MGCQALLGAHRYETAKLGQAGDLPDPPADGVTVLTFAQAEAAAREWARGKVSAERAAERSAATIRIAVEACIAERGLAMVGPGQMPGCACVATFSTHRSLMCPCWT
jgi:hypothetical protein